MALQREKNEHTATAVQEYLLFAWLYYSTKFYFVNPGLLFSLIQYKIIEKRKEFFRYEENIQRPF